MKPKKRRSPCAVACSLDIFGDKWTLLVIRDLFRGAEFHDQFIDSPERIATNILADRLERLVKSGLVEKESVEEDRRRFRYALTPRGLSLRPVLEAIAAWGLKNIPGTKVSRSIEGALPH